jgi:hypothetical protein
VEKLLLATKLMIESSQKHGKSIINRFNLIHKLCPSEDSYFAHASYMER